MWTMTRIRPAVCWWFFSCLLGLALCMRAAQADGPAVSPAGTSKPLQLSARERDWIAHNRQVIVASVQYPLYLFKDEQGHWSGLNNDILLQLSRMTGLQFVHEESFSTEHLLGLLESGRANMSTTLAMNEERKAYLDFSHAFGGSGWVFVERAGAQPVESLEALQGKVLALPARHALESAIRHEHPQIGLRSVKTYAEARALVETGEADATIENDNAIYRFPAGRLKIGASLEGKWEHDHLALRKEQPQLLSILNKALEALPPGELQAIRTKWLEGTATVPPSPWQSMRSWLFWGGLLAGVFGLISVSWRQRLNIQVKKRKAAEQALSDQLALQHSLINAMPDPVFVRDLQGRLLLCNKGYEEYLSVRLERAQGKCLPDMDVLPDATARLLHEEMMAQLSSGKSRFGERQLMLKDGVRFIYQWTVPFYSASGELRGVVGGWTEPRGRSSRTGD